VAEFFQFFQDADFAPDSQYDIGISVFLSVESIEEALAVGFAFLHISGADHLLQSALP
jgi:hypothetical protein